MSGTIPILKIQQEAKPNFNPGPQEADIPSGKAEGETNPTPKICQMCLEVLRCFETGMGKGVEAGEALALES